MVMANMKLLVAAAAMILCSLSSKAKGWGSVRSIYQFGDSLSDTGNEIVIYPTLPAARLPYGENFSLGPTGRWSNGKLIIDNIADILNVPLLPPYLPNPKGPFPTGVDFSVGGATAINISILIGQGIEPSLPVPSLQVQIGWFESYLSTQCSTFADCCDYLSSSLIVLGEVGGNDINYAIASGKTYQQILDLVPSVVNATLQGVREVIALGATRIAVPGNFPLGCQPFVIFEFPNATASAYDSTGCLKDPNKIATYQNQLLESGILNLIDEFPGVRVVYFDYYYSLLGLVQNPAAFGFDPKKVFQPCCGNGMLTNLQGFCGAPNATLCANTDEYISWDGIHLTQAAYAKIAEYLTPAIWLAAL